MNRANKPLRIILSGGGTAGHIHPAIAVADALREALGAESVEILFVGAIGKMEMERVPRAGYRIEGLPVAGLQRTMSLSNLALSWKIYRSVRRAGAIIGEFMPDAVVGFGGYASAPILWSAQRRGITTIIQEQNSYAGLTNRMLAGRASKICVAYPDMERFFPRDRIVDTGNPLLGRLNPADNKRDEAIAYFGLRPERRTLLILGGSLGTRTLNQCVMRWIDHIESQDHIQIIWQNGRYYDPQIAEHLSQRPPLDRIWRAAFIERMDLAYAAADLVLSRSGAGTVSELELMALPAIFVPSPNVAEDHQTKNARALVDRHAAEMIPDGEAVESAIPRAIELLADTATREAIASRVRELGRPHAARDVAAQIIESITQRNG